MLKQAQITSTQAQSAAPKAPAAMQVLTAEELRAVVGGPEIKNGGGGTGLTSDSTVTNG